jgi:hypothetical protein
MRSLLINAFILTDEQNRRFCFCRGAVYLHEDVVRVKVIKEALSYSGFAFMILLTLGKESKLSLHSLTRKNHEDAVRVIKNFTKFVTLIKIKY